MALNCSVGTLTQPGATGNQTISLASNFDPKAIIVWGTPQTAAGTIAHSLFGWGFGTYRGSTVSQRCYGIASTDNAATQASWSRGQSDALMVLMSTGGTLDFELDLVSMSTGATSNVIINWTNLHTTASILINYMILGGSDITDALVGHTAMATAGATQDITVVAGFGQPDLVMAFCPSTTFAASANNWALASLGIGFDDAGTIFNRYTAYTEDSGNTTMFVALRQKTGLGGAMVTSSGALDLEFALAAKAGWPTDGFRLSWVDNSAFADHIGWLALKGTFTKTLAAASNPTSTGDQNLAHSAPPTGLFMWGGNIATIAGSDTTNADLVAIALGASDGTNEAVAGFTNDDALATSDNNSFMSNAKAWQTYSPAAALLAEADASFSGNNAVLNWPDIDATAREFNYLILGSAVSAVTTIPDVTMRR